MYFNKDKIILKNEHMTVSIFYVTVYLLEVIKLYIRVKWEYQIFCVN